MMLKNRIKAAILMFAAGLWLGPLNAAKAEAPDWAGMIACRVPYQTYMSFVMVDFQDDAYKAKIKVTKIAQDNPFLHEYELAEPINVYGYTTSRVVFNASGVMAVIDEKSPLSLAEQLGLEVVLNRGTKVMATKTVVESTPVVVESLKIWHVIRQELSTVASHPDKTLLGCSYKPMVE